MRREPGEKIILIQKENLERSNDKKYIKMKGRDINIKGKPGKVKC